MSNILYLSRFPVPHMQIELAKTDTVNVVVCGQGFTVSDSLNVPNIKVVNVGHNYPVYDHNDYNITPPDELIAAVLEEAATSDYVVIDFNYMLAVHLRQIININFPKLPVLGPTHETSRLEIDRSYGHSAATQLGLPVGDNVGHTFTTKDAAIEYLTERLIEDSAFGCVLKGGFTTLPFARALDAIDVLQANPYGFFGEGRKAEDANEEGDTLWIEDFVHGEEIAFGRWFDGKNFFPVTLVNREYKGAHDNNVSQLLTGESGTFVYFGDDNSCPRITRMYAALQPKLAALNYVGFIDANFLLNDNGLHFLEWTTRWGYPTELILTHALAETSFTYADFTKALLNQDMVQQQMIAESLLAKPMGLSLAYMFAPTGSEDIDEKRIAAHPRVHGLNLIKGYAHWGCFFASYAIENGEVVVRQADSDRALILTAFATSASSARHRLYAAAEDVSLWGTYYRKDIGEELINGGAAKLFTRLETL